MNKLSFSRKLFFITLSFSIASVACYIIFNDSSTWIDELILGFSLISYWLFYFFIEKLWVKPVSLVSENTTPIRRGKLEHRVPFQTQPELVNIAKTINRLADNISSATNFIREIEEGNLEAQYTFQGERQNSQSDQLAHALKSMQEEMQKIALEEKKRNWATEGTALFSEILRQHSQDIQLLGDQLVSKIVNYLKANQAGLFIAQPEGEHTVLKMIACYAYDRKKFIQKVVKVESDYAEGLLGQAYLEQATVYLKDVPEDYLLISSGLGDAPPSAILIVPLMLNEEVVGVLELASFNTFEPHEINFLEKLGASIASTIINVRTNEQTKRLLEETQQQAEAMRAQEEEMRQNMEELQATQEEMQRKQKQLEAQNKKMEANENILHKALEKAKKAQQEAAEKNAQIAAQEEEMRQNMEELQATQEEMQRKQKLLEAQNKKMEANEVILQKALEKAKKAQQEAAEKNAQISAQEEEMRQNMEELQTTQEEMQRKQKQLEAQNKKMEANEVILKKAIEKAQKAQQEAAEKNAQISAQEEEMRQNMEELQATQEEMQRKQKQLEVQNKKMEANEVILKKAIEKSKKQAQAIREDKALRQELEQKEESIKELLEKIKINEEERQSSEEKMLSEIRVLQKTLQEKEAYIEELERKIKDARL